MIDQGDRVFGPPSVTGAGSGGGTSHKCRKCEVWWHMEGDGPTCWMCGEPGVRDPRFFAGATSRFIDEPPAWYVADEERRQARIAKAREEAA